MPAGLQVWDTDGVLQIDTSSYIGRLIGTIDASAATGSTSLAGLDSGLPFAIPVTQQIDGQYSGMESIPVCTFSGNTVTWTRQSPPTGYSMPSCTLILGVR